MVLVLLAGCGHSTPPNRYQRPGIASSADLASPPTFLATIETEGYAQSEALATRPLVPCGIADHSLDVGTQQPYLLPKPLAPVYVISFAAPDDHPVWRLELLIYHYSGPGSYGPPAPGTLLQTARLNLLGLNPDWHEGLWRERSAPTVSVISGGGSYSAQLISDDGQQLKVSGRWSCSP